MYSIRNLTATLSLGLIVLGVGCVKKSPAPKAALDNRNIPTDEAMEKRSWAQSKANYAGTSVPAGPDRFPYEASNPNYGKYLDTPLFVVNSVVWPFTYFETGINDEVNNQTGASVGSGYTAIPAGTGGGGVAVDYSGRTVPSRVGTAKGQGSVGTGGMQQGTVGGGSK